MDELPADVLQDVDFGTGEGLGPDGFKEVTGPADNAAIASALTDTSADQPPSIGLPEDDTVHLPGGYVDESGTVFTTAVVRELTGEDEEALHRARSSDDPTRFIDTLLERGVESVGPAKANSALLSELLVGDRDTLLLGIRRATYGNQIEYGPQQCPQCSAEYDLLMGVDEIPIRKPEAVEREFEVPLRKGGKAYVRLPVGADQRAVLAGDSKTDAERNTVLLSRVVLALEDKGGNRQNVAGLPSLVRTLGVSDRRKIIAELDKRMPGPKYNQGVSFTHECGYETLVPVTLMHLFPGM